MNEQPLSERTPSQPAPGEPQASQGSHSSSGPGPAPVKPVLTKKQAQRVNSSVIGMLIAIGLSMALVLPVLLLAPQKSTEAFTRNVNVAAVASQARTDTFNPAAPALGEGYTSNHADFSEGGQSKVRTWTVGYITPEKTYMQFVQTDKSNDTWLAQTVKGPKVDSRSVDGLTWDVYATNGEGSNSGSETWVNVRQGNTYLVSGEASEADRLKLASALGKTSPGSPAATAPTPSASPSAP